MLTSFLNISICFGSYHILFRNKGSERPVLLPVELFWKKTSSTEKAFCCLSETLVLLCAIFVYFLTKDESKGISMVLREGLNKG